MPTLYLLDGMALAYRAHFAFIQRPIRNSKGMNTSALFGFTSALADLLERRAPTHIAVAFDTDAPTARHEEFKDYKASRQEMPEDLAAAMPYVYRLVEAFNIPALALDGHEADDLIGTVAVRAAGEGFDVFLVTPDKDFGQLVNDRIRILKPSYKGAGEEIFGPAEVCERWNIRHPEQVIDMLALCGDASDNIPGVAGIGPRTAAKLLSEFGTLEALLDGAERLKGKLRENLIAQADKARMSKRLATINIAAPINVTMNDLIRREMDRPALEKLFAELEFRSLARRILGNASGAGEEAKGPNATSTPSADGGSNPGQQRETGVEQAELFPVAPALKTLADTPHFYRNLEAPRDTSALLEELMGVEMFCFDFETTSLDPLSTRPLGIAFSWKPFEAVWLALPAGHSAAVTEIRKLAPAFESPRIGKTGHNLKFDLSILAAAGIGLAGPLFDTMLAHALVEPEARHGMDVLAKTLLSYAPIPFDKVAPVADGELVLEQVDPAALAEYAAEDADVTLRLRDRLALMIERSGMSRVFHEIEAPLIPVLADMELTGIALDTAALRQVGAELDLAIAAAEADVFKLAGRSFQISSPKQLGVVLFDELKLADKPKKTATGQYATNEQILQNLAGRHPIIQRVLDYREAVKLKNTYVETLPRAIHPKTGRIHTSFSQLQTSTGRLASSNPNLQNIPVRSEMGRGIRRAFVAGSGSQVLLSADYSQIELRIIAGLSGDPSLAGAFARRLDIHTATAAKIYGVREGEVDREMRAKAKMVNFGIPYGISPFGLAQRLGCSRAEAGELINSYFNRFPGVRDFIERTLREARRRGYVETLTGRRRILRDINSANAPTRLAAERNAINTPIQGTAADMIKIAMIRVAARLKRERLPARMLLQVHDELLFEVEKSAVEEVAQAVAEEMRGALDIGVPIEVETGWADNWLDAH